MKVQSTGQRLMSGVLTGLFTLAICLAAGSQAYGEQPNPFDREKFHAALEACVVETGVAKPAFGTRPSEADREKISTCLSSKGFTKPEGGARGPRDRGEGRPPGPPPEELDSSNSAP